MYRSRDIVRIEILEWERFEPRAARRCQRMQWVALPVKGGRFLTALVHGHRDGWAHYGLWCRLLAIAAGEDQGARGWIGGRSRSDRAEIAHTSRSDRARIGSDIEADIGAGIALRSVSKRVGCDPRTLGLLLGRLVDLGAIRVLTDGTSEAAFEAASEAASRASVEVEGEREEGRGGLVTRTVSRPMDRPTATPRTRQDQPPTTDPERASTTTPAPGHPRSRFAETLQRIRDRAATPSTLPQVEQEAECPSEGAIGGDGASEGPVRPPPTGPPPRMAPSARGLFEIRAADLDEGPGTEDLWRRLQGRGLCPGEAGLVRLFALVALARRRSAGRTPERFLAWLLRQRPELARVSNQDEERASASLRRLRSGGVPDGVERLAQALRFR